MKYLVMETHPAYAVVLDQEGRFLKAANLRYQVGQTVEGIVPVRQDRPRRAGPVRALAAMAACLTLVLSALLWMGQRSYASVYLSINPSVRVDVNRLDRVVALEAMNEDGAALLEGYRYRYKELELVLDELVDRAVEQGFLHQGGTITLELDARSQEWVATHADSLYTNLHRHLDETMTVHIEVVGQPQRSPQGEQVIIPVVPEEDYSDTDYGESAPADDGDDAPDHSGDSDYAPADGDSGYDDDDGQTDYAPQPEPEDQDSGYEAPEQPDDGSDYADSDDGDDDDGDDDDD